VTSSDPTGVSSAWTETNVEPKASENEGLDGVSCSSVRLCILTNEHGDVFYLDRPDRRCGRVERGGQPTGSQRAAPANTFVPKLAGTPAVGEALTCSKGSWSARLQRRSPVLGAQRRSARRPL
jgi:hypothetical protein